MKKASRVLYTIGRVFNIIGIVLFITLAIIFAVGAFDEETAARIAVDMKEPLQTVKDLCMTCFVLFLIEGILNIVTLILAIRAGRSIRNEDGKIAPHVTMIVIGALAWDPFYFIGGILGTVSAKA